jgi:hypothetical protein
MLGQFQARLVAAISDGSLEDVRKLVIGKNDINKFVPLFAHSSYFLCRISRPSQFQRKYEFPH